jgi:hypothetical protein
MKLSDETMQLLEKLLQKMLNDAMNPGTPTTLDPVRVAWIINLLNALNVGEKK